MNVFPKTASVKQGIGCLDPRRQLPFIVALQSLAVYFYEQEADLCDGSMSADPITKRHPKIPWTARWTGLPFLIWNQFFSQKATFGALDKRHVDLE